jgi:hypothetical protein
VVGSTGQFCWHAIADRPCRAESDPTGPARLNFQGSARAARDTERKGMELYALTSKLEPPAGAESRRRPWSGREQYHAGGQREARLGEGPRRIGAGGGSDQQDVRNHGYGGQVPWEPRDENVLRHVCLYTYPWTGRPGRTRGLEQLGFYGDVRATPRAGPLVALRAGTITAPSSSAGRPSMLIHMDDHRDPAPLETTAGVTQQVRLPVKDICADSQDTLRAGLAGLLWNHTGRFTDRMG